MQEEGPYLKHGSMEIEQAVEAGKHTPASNPRAEDSIGPLKKKTAWVTHKQGND
jgi:hypothetical protein